MITTVRTISASVVNRLPALSDNALCKGIGALTATAVTLTPLVANAAWKTFTGSDANGMQTDLMSLMNGVINWILGFCAVIAVLMLIWGGVQYLTSAGNSDQATQGKNTIKYAVIGLVIIGLAYAIVNTVIGTLGGGEAAGGNADGQFNGE
jgi:hypothetical protein